MVGRPDEYVDGAGRYIEHNEFDVKLIREPDYYNYETNPEMSWLKALMPWGHIEVDSPGDWLESIPIWGPSDVGNNAPPGPAYDGGWNVAQGGQGYSLYTKDLPDPLVWEPSSYSTAQNASFEEETPAGEISHWHPFGAGSFESSSVHREGSRSAHFVRTAADTGSYSGFYQRYIQVEPDSTYYMGVWVKTANMTSGYVMPTFGVWENGHIVSIGQIAQDTDWTYLHGSWTAAGDEDRIQIQLPCATFLGPVKFSA
ncbi:MAG: hypothetical protein DRN21_05365 [Thermoplasmata archaeon]|nr:MAG: hypothetical protein DRN21_05365 [Thermoplasmata archaeon]